MLLDSLEDALDWARQAQDYRAILEVIRLKARLTGLLDARPGAQVNSPATLYAEAGPGPLERAQLGWPAEGGAPDAAAEHDLPLPAGDRSLPETPEPDAGSPRHLDFPLPFPTPADIDPADLVRAALAECRKEDAMAA